MTVSYSAHVTAQYDTLDCGNNLVSCLKHILYVKYYLIIKKYM